MTILNEAELLVNGDRENSYGHPTKNIERIAELWSTYTGVKLNGHDVCNMMVLLKISRHKNKYKKDNLIDICGYAYLSEILKNEEKKNETTK